MAAETDRGTKATMESASCRTANGVDRVAQAKISKGETGDTAVYTAVYRELKERGAGGSIVDLGCGGGRLYSYIKPLISDYIGVDIVHYDGFPDDAQLVLADLNEKVPLPAESADVVTSVETIEHLENPRQLMREAARLVKPGGMVVVTTPNQLSLLSLATLIFKQSFSHFQDCHYPAHITALLPVDLLRIASECKLTEPVIRYTCRGRVVFTPHHYPDIFPKLFPRACSDNVILIAAKPARDVHDL